MSVAIVVLSGFADIFRQFWVSAEKYEPNTRKIVVTSRGLQPHAPGWEIIEGASPFVYARNANAGLRAAAPDDVLLVNDDVQFLQWHSVATLERIATEHREIGILSPQFYGQVGNRMQSRKHRLRALAGSKERLCFTAVYLRRDVIERIGELDERFVLGTAEDDDYCLRVQNAGLRLAVTPDVVMRHGFGALNASASFARTHADTQASADRMWNLFREKWKGVVTWGRP